jgi:hypothetical protein
MNNKSQKPSTPKSLYYNNPVIARSWRRHSQTILIKFVNSIMLFDLVDTNSGTFSHEEIDRITSLYIK